MRQRLLLLLRRFWPLPLIAAGTTLAILGAAYSSCNCEGSGICNCPSIMNNYALGLFGLVVTILFTFVFVLSSTSKNRIQVEAS